MRRRLFLITSGVALLLGALTACGAPAGPSLAQTRWVLTGIETGGALQPPVAGSQVTLEFTADGVGGSGGCNSYGGGYTVRGNAISFGELAQTMMACERAELMEQEGAYMAALATAKTFTLDGNTLTIATDGGSLRFARG
jgi:putative lipoprotein